MDTLNDLLWTKENDDLVIIPQAITKPREIEYFTCEHPAPFISYC